LPLGLRSKRQVLNLLRTLRRRSTLYVAKGLLETVIGMVEGYSP
jgi:hypothetical protein